MTARTDRHRVGDLRPSQLLFSFGVGAMVDLPHLSTMVMGLDDWDTAQMQEVGEERLLSAVRAQVGGQVSRLLSPPVPPEDADSYSTPFDQTAQVGVPVASFPRWVRCPYCNLLAPLHCGLFRLETNIYRPDRTRYLHVNCRKPGKPPAVLPARFLIACSRGHLDDFPWLQYVHRGTAGCPGPLRLQEYGVSGTTAAVEVGCSACGQKRRMVEAFDSDSAGVLGPCTRRRPHLRDHEEGDCPEPARAILLGASNSWFPIQVSVLSLPTAIDRLGQLIEANWSVLEKVTSREVLAAFRQIGQLRFLAEFPDEAIWAAIQARRTARPTVDPEESPDIKTPEWEIFSRADPDHNSPDLRLIEVEAPPGYERCLTKVVLVARLREVRALLGFTRIESPGDFIEAGEIPADRRAPLSRKPPTWVPASEVRGEGLFLEFAEESLVSWSREPAVTDRWRDLKEAHRKWCAARGIQLRHEGFPGIRYVLLHSLAHALMRQLAIECGYTTASIRERIYSREPGGDRAPMAGILLYTAAPDCEGTLGGLVELGRPRSLARHLGGALRQARLCSSDPLCAEHHPHRDGVTLHGAACHACLFTPETSCERGNRYLDRALLVQAFGSPIRGFFDVYGPTP